MISDKPLYYHDYLHLDKVLDSQHPYSANFLPEAAHDEMLFIIIHQTFELWFRQIIHELDTVNAIFKQQRIDDNSGDMSIAVHRLNRVGEIFKLINQQFVVLETMTPLDFLDFREYLSPSSGFQSTQFRLIEAKLGLKMDHRHYKEYYKHTGTGGFEPNDLNRINHTEHSVSLLELTSDWLERMPYYADKYWQGYTSGNGEQHPQLHKFWSDYRNAFASTLIYESEERKEQKLKEFDHVFFHAERSPEEPFSAKAAQAAMFIMLYRDYPMVRAPYALLNALIEIDEYMALWRHRHLMMVRRMIGMRVGTGGTSGAGYLEGALSKHNVFKDLSGLSTFLVARTHLPQLPEGLTKHLGFLEF